MNFAHIAVIALERALWPLYLPRQARDCGMLIGKPRVLGSSEITPRDIYLNRRGLLAGAAGLIGAATLLPGDAAAAALRASKSPLSTDEKPTSLKDVSSYNIG